MPDSIRLKPKEFLPLPRTIACFTFLITALAFIAGSIRNELALILLGTIFLAILVYCFLAVFFLGIVHRRKTLSISMSIIPDNVKAGENGELHIKTASVEPSRFWKLPATLIRCELFLETKDGRVIRHFASVGDNNLDSILVKDRGVYFGEKDSFVISDAPGFFRLSLPLEQRSGPRLFALPSSIEEPIKITLKSGGDEQRKEVQHKKSDELTDHRPYYPGDDPRRINWKLYSHSPIGELMVRKEDTLSPPHLRRLILIDTEVDQLLYTLDEGRRAVDLLCESVLSAAQEFSALGVDVSFGYTGGKIISAQSGAAVLSAKGLALALAWPAAVLLPRENMPRAYLPDPQDDQFVIIFALPRILQSGDTEAAIDNFLRKKRRGLEIIFLYDKSVIADKKRAVALEDAAKHCVSSYNRKTGIHAEKVVVSPGWIT